MKTMILAAGRGERMRPLTDDCPKPLLAVGGKALIVHLIERLRDAGLTELVINHAHLGERLIGALGDGGEMNVHIHWSAEPPGALETAGGIRKALPLLGDEAFLVVNGDLWCDWDFSSVAAIAADMKARRVLAHLVMVDNPPHNIAGDFALDGDRIARSGEAMLTFAGIGVYAPALFADLRPGERAALAPLLRAAMAEGKVTGERHRGIWVDVGTPQRLADLDGQLRASEHKQG